ncbi:hypothetical protein BDR05DRAFT_857069, partial [Suillus weaverae]
DVTIWWLPGHSDIHGNEEADNKAKRAAERHRNNSPTASLPDYLQYNSLPLSISALKEAHCKEIHACW